MTHNHPDFLACSELAFQQALPGTAPTAAAWVIFEYSGAWSREALSPETFGSDPMGPELLQAAALLESLGAKVLLARESGATHAPLTRNSRAWVAGAPDFATGISTIGDVLDALGEAAGGTLTEILKHCAASQSHDPHLFVCCHGKRDQCCAVKGRALVGQLHVMHTRIWECSHLGGHRFSPTALLLPHGAVFGRLTTESMNSILAGTSYGLEELRGLSALRAVEQVMDVAAKELWCLPWFAPLSFHQVGASDDHDTFDVTGPDGRHARITVRPSNESLPVSCGKPSAPTMVWKVVDVSED
ncbi:MAG: hypothetical protein RJB01_1445 [Actinomycetota bacterium]|jgi:hypothetical protein